MFGHLIYLVDTKTGSLTRVRKDIHTAIVPCDFEGVDGEKCSFGPCGTCPQWKCINHTSQCEGCHGQVCDDCPIHQVRARNGEWWHICTICRDDLLVWVPEKKRRT